MALRPRQPADFLLSGLSAAAAAAAPTSACQRAATAAATTTTPAPAARSSAAKACDGERLPRREARTRRLRPARLRSTATERPDRRGTRTTADRGAARARPALEERPARHRRGDRAAASAPSTATTTPSSRASSTPALRRARPRLQTRLDALRAQEADLSHLGAEAARRRHGRPRSRRRPTRAHDRRGEPKKTKALLRLLIKELRVNGSRRSCRPTASSRTRFAHCQFSGRYWARTSDPQLVELVLSQLS